jgi:hypothetical protein
MPAPYPARPVRRINARAISKEDSGIPASSLACVAGKRDTAHHRSESLVTEAAKQWDGAIVRTWLESRIAAARADQVVAERAGYGQHDECDKAAAEEMICTLLKAGDAASQQGTFADALKRLLAREEFTWRGVYDDTRFERHARSTIRKILKMTKANTGFENTKRYQ